MKKKEQKLGDTLKQRAIEFGLCEQGQREWGKNHTIDSLLDKYVDGIEFIIDHPDFLPYPFLIEKAGKERLNLHGIYIDDEVILLNPDTVVLNGSCGSVIDAERYAVPDVYLRDNSVLNLRATDNAIVHVSIYDKAILNIKCLDAAKVFVYQYGGYVNKSGNGKVIVRERMIT